MLCNIKDEIFLPKHPLNKKAPAKSGCHNKMQISLEVILSHNIQAISRVLAIIHILA
jgi:hypothetical protein